MNKWFRFYNDAFANPKVAKLTDKQFRLWVQLLAVASKNDGFIPSVTDLKHVLNRRLDHLLTGVKELLSAGLITPYKGGFTPNDWNEYQYKSDTSAERTRKYRNSVKRHSDALDTDTDTDTDTDLSPSQDSSCILYTREGQNSVTPFRAANGGAS